MTVRSRRHHRAGRQLVGDLLRDQGLDNVEPFPCFFRLVLEANLHRFARRIERDRHARQLLFSIAFLDLEHHGDGLVAIADAGKAHLEDEMIVDKYGVFNLQIVQLDFPGNLVLTDTDKEKRHSLLSRILGNLSEAVVHRGDAVGEHDHAAKLGAAIMVNHLAHSGAQPAVRAVGFKGSD